MKKLLIVLIASLFLISNLLLGMSGPVANAKTLAPAKAISKSKAIEITKRYYSSKRFIYDAFESDFEGIPSYTVRVLTDMGTHVVTIQWISLDRYTGSLLGIGAEATGRSLGKVTKSRPQPLKANDSVNLKLWGKPLTNEYTLKGIYIGAPLSQVTATLGNPLSIVEFVDYKGNKAPPPTAANGYAIGDFDLFRYKDFDIITGSLGPEGGGTVDAIKFTSSRLQTRRGIKIGDPLSKVLKAYGKDGVDKNGMETEYSYYGSDGQLSFIIQNNKVKNIYIFASPVDD